MAEIKCPKCGSTNAYNFQDKENWYRCRDCLEFLYANEHGVVDCETLGKAARQYAISHNITVTSPLVAGTRTFFDKGGNDITSKIIDDWLRGLTMTENERMNSIKGKIKPCLCGSVPSLKYERVGYYDDRLYFFIHCEKCGIKMEGIPHSPFLANEESAKFAEETVEKWNSWIRRADDGRSMSSTIKKKPKHPSDEDVKLIEGRWR